MDRQQLRERLGPWGVDTFRTSFLSPPQAGQLARGLDEQGWPALWIPEIGRTEASATEHRQPSRKDLA